MNSIISELKSKLDEQQQLLLVLAMWDKVKQQGIDPESVKSFGFDPSLMTAADRSKARRESRRSGGIATSQNPFGWPVSDGTVYTAKFNFVKTKTGKKLRLSPMIDRV